CSASYTISQADLDAGSVTNTAQGFGQFGDQMVPSNEDSETVTTDNQNPALTLDKTADPMTYSAVGDVISYSYELTNSGNVTLTQPFTVVDDKSTDEQCPATPASLAPGESITCSASYTISQADLDAGSVTNTAQGFGQFGDQMVPSNEDSETVTAEQNPAIDIEKATNGFDADVAPGPSIVVGATVTWTYVVENAGNVELTGIVVTDDQGVAVSCPATVLAAGASMNCTAGGTAVAGQYANLGTATGTPPLGDPVTDSDPSHYFGVDASIDIEKATNGEDADVGPGPIVDEGSEVTWTYVVTNTGNVTLTGVQVTDDIEGAICTIDTLAVGESQTCTRVGTAEVGEYENIGTATGNPPVGLSVTDTDPSHYTGRQIVTGVPIRITKSVNGGPIPEGTSFTFQVRDPDGVFIDNPAYAVEITSTTPQPAELGPVSPGIYSLCEVGASPMWNTTLIGMPGAFFPDGDPGTVCIPLVVEEGVELIEFSIDNDNDRNETLTIGYWKNHCEPAIKKGKFQRNKNKIYTDQLLYETQATISLGDGLSFRWEGNDPTANGFKPHVDGYIVTISDGEVLGETGCWSMELILDKRSIDDKAEHASDPAFNMAAQLLAAELNYLNGALACVGVTDAINDGREVLSQVGFNGEFGDDGYSGELEELGLTTLARDLATVLDNYNNGMTEPCAYEAYGDFMGLLFEKTTNGWDADIAWPMFVPQVEAGSTVEWSYTITNKLGGTLTEIKVDDGDLEIDCGGTTELADGGSLTCTASGTAADGLYRNLGTVTGNFDDDEVSNNDPSHYFGTTP
ncbi:MAG TPA: hypothetical protein VLT32_08415, partial [Candidatus Sulfomarinibacteraceae bacterium]|nr:hypothetical protein [Candidatus Sulfomarinibacteraceae bacterium]